MTSQSQKDLWDVFNAALQNNATLSKSIFHTYTYDPLFGMTSETDPNGKTTYYQYDPFGRLKCIKDHDDNVLKQMDYHYKNQ